MLEDEEDERCVAGLAEDTARNEEDEDEEEEEDGEVDGEVDGEEDGEVDADDDTAAEGRGAGAVRTAEAGAGAAFVLDEAFVDPVLTVEEAGGAGFRTAEEEFVLPAEERGEGPAPWTAGAQRRQ